MKNKILTLSVVTIAIVLMASSIPLLQAQSTDYMHVYLWNNTNKERYADGRIRIYKGSQPSVIGGQYVWRNKLFDTVNEIGPIPTSSVSWYGAESNETYTVRANSTSWGGEVSKVVTGGGVVELFFDSATEPSDIPDEIPEEPTETPEEPTVDNSTPENNSETELKDYSTELLLILVIAIVVIVVIVVLYRMAKKKNSRGSTDYHQTAS